MLSTDMGCDNADPIADATAFGDGWLVAYSDWAGSITSCGALNPEAASRLNIAKVTADAATKMIASMDVGGSIAEIHAVPHPDGIQLAYRLMGLAVAPIQLVRVSALDGLVVGTTAITAPGAMPREGFATAALGSGIAIAWVEGLAGSPGDLHVSVRDSSGAERATISLGTVNSVGPIAAIGAPNTESLVLAWATSTTVRLTRLDCTM
ncbi:MAG: hypothetical protein IPI67_26625 [Myxococcales bacterium]|nr:hypothetical protein [Myxococcales bacterium]